jgi:hypothetical protein
MQLAGVCKTYVARLEVSAIEFIEVGFHLAQHTYLQTTTTVLRLLNDRNADE